MQNYLFNNNFEIIVKRWQQCLNNDKYINWRSLEFLIKSEQMVAIADRCFDYEDDLSVLSDIAFFHSITCLEKNIP